MLERSQDFGKLLGPDLAPEQFSAALTAGRRINAVKPGGQRALKAVLSSGEERLVAVR